MDISTQKFKDRPWTTAFDDNSISGQSNLSEIVASEAKRGTRIASPTLPTDRSNDYRTAGEASADDVSSGSQTSIINTGDESEIDPQGEDALTTGQMGMVSLDEHLLFGINASFVSS